MDKETDAIPNLDWLDHDGHGILGSGELFLESQNLFTLLLMKPGKTWGHRDHMLYYE